MTSKDHKLLVKVIRQTRFDTNGSVDVRVNIVADKVINRLMVNLVNALKKDSKKFDDDQFWGEVYE